MEVCYDDIKNKVKENFIKGLYFERKYKDDIQKREVLSLTLGERGYKEEEVYSFVEFSSGGYKIYEYESRKAETDKIRENLLVSRDYLPVLKLEHFRPKNSSVNYCEDTYTIYQDGSNRIASKISITSLKVDDFEDTDVTVLDSDELNAYYQKKYHFMIRNNTILSLRVGNEMFLNGETDFSIRSDAAFRCIDKLLNKVHYKIEKETDEDVKEYHILRKKQEH